MHYDFVGMHFLWWAFWLILIVPFFFIATPVRRRTARLYRENPFDILQRRYAAGELTTEQYEERKTRIDHDMSDPRFQALSATTSEENATA